MAAAARSNSGHARTSRRTGRKRAGAKPAAQGILPFRPGRGGARKGAGRKPTGLKAGVDHRERAALASRYPVHITVKLREHLPRLRQKAEYGVLRTAFARGCNRNLAGTFRLCHYAILNDHLHLLVEAQSRLALSRGLQGLLIRIARALNKLWRRKGRVFADRYHDHVLRSLREVRNALRYLFGNGKKHAREGREVSVPQAMDVFTSAPWFDGFRERIEVVGIEAVVRPVTDSKTWMLSIGWRELGLLSVHDVPPARGAGMPRRRRRCG
jgi:REP element-mobilizing transposase RayT